MLLGWNKARFDKWYVSWSGEQSALVVARRGPLVYDLHVIQIMGLEAVDPVCTEPQSNNAPPVCKGNQLETLCRRLFASP